MRARWRLLFASAVGVGAFLAPVSAQAHPLGNFTINTGAAIVVRTGEVVVDYVVDMAEIPTIQERTTIDRNRDATVSSEEAKAYRASACAGLAGGLVLDIDGRLSRLAVRSSSLTFPAGQAGLRTLRLACILSTPVARATVHRVAFEDTNYPGRIGWHEVTAAGDGTTITKADVPQKSPSSDLRSYPTNVVSSNVRTASVEFRPGGPDLLAGSAGATATTNGGILAGLAARPDLSVGLMALMVLIAVAVGAVHALGPGHGKALIGAYMVGANGTLRQAIAVGAAVSVMHTASVVGLGLLVLSAEQLVAPERVYPWLGFASGLVALGLGSALLVSRIHALAERDGHGHDHPHPAPLSRRSLVALAFAGGILPSPSALVVLLGSISLGRTALGLVLIGAFSVGLAASLIGIGALAVRTRRIATGRVSDRWLRLAPVVSAGCIATVGLALTARGILQI